MGSVPELWRPEAHEDSGVILTGPHGRRGERSSGARQMLGDTAGSGAQERPPHLPLTWGRSFLCCRPFYRVLCLLRRAHEAQHFSTLLTKEMTMKVKTNVKAGLSYSYVYKTPALVA